MEQILYLCYFIFYHFSNLMFDDTGIFCVGPEGTNIEKSFVMTGNTMFCKIHSLHFK